MVVVAVQVLVPVRRVVERERPVELLRPQLLDGGQHLVDGRRGHPAAAGGRREVGLGQPLREGPQAVDGRGAGVGAGAAGLRAVGHAGDVADRLVLQALADAPGRRLAHRHVEGHVARAADLELAVAVAEVTVGQRQRDRPGDELRRVGRAVGQGVHVHVGRAGVAHRLVFVGHLAVGVEAAQGHGHRQVLDQPEPVAGGQLHAARQLLPGLLGQRRRVGRHRQRHAPVEQVVDQVRLDERPRLAALAVLLGPLAFEAVDGQARAAVAVEVGLAVARPVGGRQLAVGHGAGHEGGRHARGVEVVIDQWHLSVSLRGVPPVSGPTRTTRPACPPSGRSRPPGPRPPRSRGCPWSR